MEMGTPLLVMYTCKSSWEVTAILQHGYNRKTIEEEVERVNGHCMI